MDMQANLLHLTVSDLDPLLIVSKDSRTINNAGRKTPSLDPEQAFSVQGNARIGLYANESFEVYRRNTLLRGKNHLEKPIARALLNTLDSKCETYNSDEWEVSSSLPSGQSPLLIYPITEVGIDHPSLNDVISIYLQEGELGTQILTIDRENNYEVMEQALVNRLQVIGALRDSALTTQRLESRKHRR